MVELNTEENREDIGQYTQWRRQGGDWGDEFPPVIIIIDFEIFLILKGKEGGGTIIV